jgi:hypothetical protein
MPRVAFDRLKHRRSIAKLRRSVSAVDLQNPNVSHH